ncbi:hypothetical protein LTR85_010674 [Meristemomyces frigidus]|nr:hypothetical protein LTR85_010674 [Meristemomyces frigidus]
MQLLTPTTLLALASASAALNIIGPGAFRPVSAVILSRPSTFTTSYTKPAHVISIAIAKATAAPATSSSSAETPDMFRLLDHSDAYRNLTEAAYSKLAKSAERTSSQHSAAPLVTRAPTPNKRLEDDLAVAVAEAEAAAALAPGQDMIDNLVQEAEKMGSEALAAAKTAPLVAEGSD